MTERGDIADYTEAELRWLLSEKVQSNRQMRLERFRRTGRAIILVPENQPEPLEALNTIILTEDDEQTARPPRGKKHVRGRLLLIIEAVVLFFFVIFLLGGSLFLRNANQTAAAAWVLPTLTPTPLIRPQILPPIRPPGESPVSSRRNVPQIPEHLLPFTQSWPSIPAPTAAPEMGIRIQIPAIDVDAPIVQGDGWEQLKKGVGQHTGTANPGRNGNMVLTGHNDVFGEVFRYLDRLQPGDAITIYTNQRSYTYIVSDWIIVEPTQVEVMDPTPDATLTLISCYPYLIDSQRIIVRAKLTSS